jgi:hypothetical protein
MIKFSIIGLGYDAENDDYIIATYCNNDPFRDSCTPNTSRYFIHLYSIKTRAWSRVDGCDDVYDPYDGFYLEGAIHWLQRYHQNGGNNEIFALDLVTKEIRKFPVPGSTYYITSSGGMLIMVNRVYDVDGHYIDVWRMTEYGIDESWIKLFRVKVGIYFNLHPIFSWVTYQGVVLCCFGELFVYDWYDESYSELLVVSEEEEQRPRYYFYCNHVESLVSPSLLGGENVN